MGKKTAGSVKKNGELRYCTKCLIVSVLSGAVTIALLACAFSALFAAQDVPLGLFHPLAAAALVAGCLIAGFVCAKMMSQKGMVWGGISGSMLFLLLVVLYLFGDKISFGAGMISKFFMMATAGMLGGVFGVNFRHR